MRTFAKARALGFLLVAALAGCAFDGASDESGTDADEAYKIIAQYNANLPMCRWLGQRLEGRQGVFYKLRDLDNFMAFSADGQVICVDEPVIILRAGAIPISGGDDTGGCGNFELCDGTPLPADKVMEIAKKFYGDQHTDF